MLLYNQLLKIREGVLMQLRKVTEEDLFSLIKLENEGFTPDEVRMPKNFETENQ